MDGERALGLLEETSRVPLEYEEWLRELRRYVHRLTGDPDVSEDVAQEAVMRLEQARRTHAVQQPRAWLYRAATNIVRDQARHDAMRQRRVPPGGDELSESPEYELERRETIRAVRAALERIPARDRELLILRESGFRHREIADIIGVKAESVSTLAARALERFRNAYAGGSAT
jgi:RNA polymerase sigma factor (sigma-70 family)